MRSLSKGLPRQPKKDGHFAALPYDELPSLLATLVESESIGRLALQFLILTAARSGEVRGARWEEIDVNAAVWTVPAERMKAGKQHLVPLSEPALAILKRMKEVASDDLVFPGITGRAPSVEAIGKGVIPSDKPTAPAPTISTSGSFSIGSVCRKRFLRNACRCL
jgi:integrase